MILKTLYLKIGDTGLTTDYTYSFLKRSRFICNYVEREVLKAIKFDADGFNRVSIALSSGVKRESFINSSKVLCVDLPFEKTRYDSLLGEQLSLFYVENIKNGLNAVAGAGFGVPKEAIISGLNDFVTSGMKNHWLHTKKAFAKFGVKAFLWCELTQEWFRLKLKIEKESKLLFSECILETDPDENAFEYRFKDIKLEGEEIVITSKTSEPLYRASIADLV